MRHVQRVVLLFFCLALVRLPVYAQWAGAEQMRRVAEAFFGRTGVDGVARSAGIGSRDVKLLQAPLCPDAPAVYGAGSRYVVVAPTANAARVVGYGVNPVPNASLPLPMRTMLQRPLVVEALPETTVAEIAPLLNSVRSQGAPFNAACPYYTNGDAVSTERCLVGCVATALEQIITYHRYPTALCDTLFGWSTDNYTVATVPPGVAIDYDVILPVYEDGCYDSRQAQAVADLSLYCGLAAGMNWGLRASGANLRTLVPNMRRAFGYRGVKYVDATYYSTERWRQMMDAELAARRPVLYAGYTSLVQGHAFVLDGRDSQGFYHVNWGYGGQYDGYFDLSVFNTFAQPLYPTDEGAWLGHYALREALLLSPDSVAWVDNDTVADYHTFEITDVRFLRPPAVNGYVAVEVKVRNLVDEIRNVALELFTFNGQDSIGFRDVDLFGVTGGDIEAGAERWLRCYGHFRIEGERDFCVTDDERRPLYLSKLEVGRSSSRGVTVGDVDSVFVRPDAASFALSLYNNSDEMWVGAMLTYSLFEGPYTEAEGDVRQWRLPMLPPGESLRDSVTFYGLKPATDYTFVVRNPWFPAATIAFRTPAEPMAVLRVPYAAPERPPVDLSGRYVSVLSPGRIYIIGERKIIAKKP